MFKVINIVPTNPNKNMNMLYMKRCQNLTKMIKKLLDGQKSTLEFFLLKHIIFLFQLAYSIFRTFTKNAIKKFKLEKIIN